MPAAAVLIATALTRTAAAAAPPADRAMSAYWARCGGVRLRHGGLPRPWMAASWHPRVQTHLCCWPLTAGKKSFHAQFGLAGRLQPHSQVPNPHLELRPSIRSSLHIFLVPLHITSAPRILTSTSLLVNYMRSIMPKKELVIPIFDLRRSEKKVQITKSHPCRTCQPFFRTDNFPV